MKKICILFLFYLTACSTAPVNMYYDDSRQLTPPDADSLERSEEVKTNSGYLQNFISAELAYRRENFEQAEYFLKKISGRSSHNNIVALRLAELGLLKNNPESGLSEMESSLYAAPSESKFDILAMLYLANHNEKSAIEVLTQKLKTFPAAENTRIQLAWLYTLIDRYEEAQAILDKPISLRELSLAAYISERLNKLSDAERFYQQAIKKEGGLELLPGLIRVLGLLNNNAAITELIEKQSKDLPEVEKLKEIMTNGQLDTIGEYLPVYSLPLSELQFINMQIQLASEDIVSKNTEAAIIRILALTYYFPKNSSPYFIGFTAYRDLRKDKSAIAVLERVPEDDSLRSRALIMIALTLRADKQYKAAEQYILEAMDLSPGNENIFALYLLNLNGQKKIVQAEKAVREYLEDNPDNQYYMFEHATLLFELRKTEEAHDLLEKLISQNPHHAGALNFLAYTYAESGNNLDKALDYVNKALLIEPNNPAYLDTLAWIYFKQNRFKDAAATQGAAVKILPEDPVLSEHYGDILNALGQISEAQDWYRQSQIQAKDTEPSYEIEKLLERLKQKIK